MTLFSRIQFAVIAKNIITTIKQSNKIVMSQDPKQHSPITVYCSAVKHINQRQISHLTRGRMCLELRSKKVFRYRLFFRKRFPVQKRMECGTKTKTLSLEWRPKRARFFLQEGRSFSRATRSLFFREDGRPIDCLLLRLFEPRWKRKRCKRTLPLRFLGIFWVRAVSCTILSN